MEEKKLPTYEDMVGYPDYDLADPAVQEIATAILWAGERIGRSLDKAAEALEQLAPRG